jgi:hypothetical protein
VLFSVLAFSAIGSYLSDVNEERLAPALIKVLALLVVLRSPNHSAADLYGLVGLARDSNHPGGNLMALLAMVMGCQCR